MIVAVLDTNILASGAIATAGLIASLIQAWRRGRVQVAVSSHILRELETTLSKPYLVIRLYT